MVVPNARWVALLLLALAGSTTWPADLQLSPVSIQFNTADRAQALWLTNSGVTPLHAQVRVFRWTQVQGEDRLDPTNDLVASPPLVEIEPGRSQLVRIVRRSEVAGLREESFRLLVDEIPIRQEGSSKESPGRPSLQFLLRYSVPVFIGSELGSQAFDASGISGEWTGAPAAPKLTIVNTGPRRLRISEVVHEDASGRKTTLVPGLLGYVLAGQRVSWPMPASARNLGPGVIKARLHEAPQDFPIATTGNSP